MAATAALAMTCLITSTLAFVGGVMEVSTMPITRSYPRSKRQHSLRNLCIFTPFAIAVLAAVLLPAGDWVKILDNVDVFENI
jgi:4-hydroxybenzoate polyprenyltransferase